VVISKKLINFEKVKNRLGYHFLFWGIYYIICLYNELYLSPSFLSHPELSLFYKAVLAVFLLLIIKITVVYFILYGLIPSWIDDKRRVQFILFTILSLLVGAFLMRMMMHLIIWPCIYKDKNVILSVSTFVARYFYSLLDLVQIAGIAVSVKLYKLRSELIKKEKKLIIERSRAELMHLKSQINPHFLFNTLNSIYSLAREKSENTADTVMRLSKLMRYTLYDTVQKTVSIKDELKMIADYIELQQLRFSNRMEVKLEINIDKEEEQITPLILLPIVENSYKHCDVHGAIASFKLNLINRRLTLIATNPVCSNEVLKKGTGLSNVQKQIKLLYKDFNFKYYIDQNQFILELFIDLNSYTGNELFDLRR
jgi:sensor histidine kinase YesM